MLAALPFGNAYATSRNYLTVIVLNFVIAISMLCTPMIVKSLVGGGFSVFADTLTPITTAAMLTAPAKAASMMSVGRGAISTTKEVYGRFQNSIESKIQRNNLQREIKGLNSNNQKRS